MEACRCNGGGHDFAVSAVDNFLSTPPAAAVLRQWNIMDLTGGDVSANLTFQWKGTAEDPAFDRNNCYVGHSNGGAWNPVSSTGPASGSDPYQKTASGINSFSVGMNSLSAFGIFNGNMPALPMAKANHPSASIAVTIYPNPASEQLHVTGLEQFREAWLIDINGRKMRQWKIHGSQPLDIRTIPPGSYTLQLLASDRVFTQMVVIAR